MCVVEGRVHACVWLRVACYGGGKAADALSRLDCRCLLPARTSCWIEYWKVA